MGYSRAGSSTWWAWTSSPSRTTRSSFVQADALEVAAAINTDAWSGLGLPKRLRRHPRQSTGQRARGTRYGPAPRNRHEGVGSPRPGGRDADPARSHRLAVGHGERARRADAPSDRPLRFHVRTRFRREGSCADIACSSQTCSSCSPDCQHCRARPSASTGVDPPERYTFENGIRKGLKGRRGGYQGRMDERREAMGIDWMNSKELNNSIPPAYTEYIGVQLRQHLEGTANAERTRVSTDEMQGRGL